MDCLPTYKGKKYNSIAELIKENNLQGSVFDIYQKYLSKDHTEPEISLSGSEGAEPIPNHEIPKNIFETKINQYTYNYDIDNQKVYRKEAKTGNLIEEKVDAQINKVLVDYALSKQFPIQEFNRNKYVQINGKTLNIANGNEVTQQQILDLFKEKEPVQKTYIPPSQKGVFTFPDGIAVKTRFDLNDQQKEALIKMFEYYNDKDKKFFTLQGYAGTGKTSIIKLLSDYIEKKHYARNIVFSSPTHRANAVLKQSLRGKKVLTLHKVFGLSPLMDLEHFSATDVTFEKQKDTKISRGDILIIDESSMINNDLFQFITENSEKLGIKVLFMGDPAQIKPVKQNELSKAFAEVKDRYELTKVERTGDNPLLEEVTNIRNSSELEQMSITSKSNPEGEGVTFSNDPQEIYSKAVELFSSQEFKDNPLLVRMVSGTNSNVAESNKIIRKGIWGDDASNEYNIGEVLMGYDNFDMDYRTGESKIINSGDYIVTKVSELKEEDGIKYYHLTIQDIIDRDAPSVSIKVLSNKNTKDVFDKIGKEFESLRKYAMSLPKGTRQAAFAWTALSDYKARYASPKDITNGVDKFGNPAVKIKKSLDYGYAHTIHKSQGGTYKNIIVDSRDIARFPDPQLQKQLKYVALSRAQEHAYVLTDKTIKVAEETKEITSNQEGDSESEAMDTKTFQSSEEFNSRYNTPTEVKPGVSELFDSNPELANEVYKALGFQTKPDVILPIGTSGSGKSTFIKSLPQENLIIIEPDAMRVEFTGDINDKSEDKEIYVEAANRAIQAIKQGKQVVFDTTNLTKDKRLPFIEAIKKEIPNVNIQYKLMELNPELAKQRIKAQLERGENRAVVSDATIDRHAESYKQMREDIKNEPINNYEITPQQKQQAQQLYSEYLDTIFPDSEVKDIVYRGVGKEDIKLFQYWTNNRAEAYMYAKANITKSGKITERNPLASINKEALDYFDSKYGENTYYILSLDENSLQQDWMMDEDEDGFYFIKDEYLEEYEKIKKDYINQPNILKKISDKDKELLKNIKIVFDLYDYVKIESESDLMKKYDDTDYINNIDNYKKAREYVDDNLNLKKIRENIGQIKTALLNIRNPYIEEIVQEDLQNDWDAYKKGHDGAFLMDGDHFLVKSNTEQIHILGSKQDVEGFKKFINKEEVDLLATNVSFGYNEQKEYYLAKNTKSLLEDIVKFSKDIDTKALAKAVSQIPNIGKIKLEVIKYNAEEKTRGKIKDVEKASGVFRTAQNKIEIVGNLEKEAFETIFLHETIHAITTNEYYYNKEFAAKINILYSHMLKFKDYNTSTGVPLGKMYGMSNPREFMAEAMSNPAFIFELSKYYSPLQEKLKTKNIFQEFIDIISNMIKEKLKVKGKTYIENNLGQNVLNVISNYTKVSPSIFGTLFQDQFKTIDLGNGLRVSPLEMFPSEYDSMLDLHKCK